MNLLEQAIIIATKAHAGQIDKGGNLYILHPLSIMLKMPDDRSKIVAVLHDIIEDTSITPEDLKNLGFGDDILIPLDYLTRKKNETYMEFVRRAAQHPVSKLVKMADIENNMDLTRISNPTKKDYDRVKKYEKALKILKMDDQENERTI
ncbi:GTP pyrophosphokinase [Alkaliphilus sp. B6464]|uniref:GTP pyrophosphokinase n=1 Tax=Alkaliphilus sp. B6464 TaxID=2731219 RepID=UPI001BAAAF69|nr:GTP pyrophosphokinase [Alkaliphilus sp. B6464]QUH21877.1 GTP pyrophosphokinase [Alkaliphilus sp. B6464]